MVAASVCPARTARARTVPPRMASIYCDAHGTFRLRDVHDTVAADHRIETVVGKRQPLGIALAEFARRDQALRQLDDLLREVQPGRLRATADRSFNQHAGTGANIENPHPGA